MIFGRQLHVLKSKAQGKVNAYCEGMLNYAAPGLYYFFQEVDSDILHEPKEDRILLDNLTLWAKRCLPNDNWEIKLTQAGYHVIGWTPLLLEDLRYWFDNFSDNFPNDYKWTVPLTLRTSPKYHPDTLEVISTSPVPVIRGEGYQFPSKIRMTWYRNWE